MQMDDRHRYSQGEGGEGYNRYITAEPESFRKIAWKKQILQHFDARDGIKVLDVGTGVIRGPGNSRSPTLYQLIGGIGNVIAVLKLIMARSPVAGSVAWVYPISWICTSLCLFIYYKTDRWLPERI